MTEYTEDLCTGGTAAADSQYNHQTGPEKAFDDSTQNYSWQSDTSGFPHWIGYQFTEAQAIARVRIYQALSSYATDFVVEGSNDADANWDDKSWASLHSASGASEDTWDVFDFANETAYKYVRLKATSGQNADVWSVTEIEMMAEIVPVYPTGSGYGMRGRLGIGFQESWGTAITGSYHWVPVINESITESIEDLVSEGLRGRFEPGAHYEGAHEVAGDIVAEAHPILLGKFLKAWCGYGSGTATDDAYSHEFKPRTQDFDKFAAVPPMTLHIFRDVGSAVQFHDMLCDQLTIELSYGRIVRQTAGLIGGGYSEVNPASAEFWGGNPFLFCQASLEIHGAATKDFTQLTVTMMNQLAGEGTLDGTRRFNRIKRSGSRRIEIAGTVIFCSFAEYQAWRERAGRSLRLTVTGDEVASGYNAQFTADFPQVLYTEYPANIQGRAQIKAGIKAVAEYNADSGTSAAFTLVNTLEAY